MDNIYSSRLTDIYGVGEQTNLISLSRQSPAITSDGRIIEPNNIRLEPTNFAVYNLLSANTANGGENGTTNGFGAQSTVTLTATTVNSYNGNYSIQVATSGTNANEGLITTYIYGVIPSGQTYTASAYIFGTGGNVMIDINERDINGTDLGDTSVYLTVPTIWNRFSVTRTFTSGTTVSMKIHTSGTAKLTYYVDNLQIEQSSYAKPWVPGQTYKSFGAGLTTNLLLPNQANVCEDGAVDGFGPDNGTALTFSADNTTSVLGNYSLKVVTSGSGSNLGIYTNVLTSVNPSGTYTASGYIKGTGNFCIGIEEKYNGAWIGATDNFFSISSNTFQRYSVNRTFSSGNNTDMTMLTNGTVATTYWVDGFQIESGSACSNYWIPPGYSSNGAGMGATVEEGVTNMIRNGDLSQGTSYWGVTNGAGSTGAIQIVNDCPFPNINGKCIQYTQNGSTGNYALFYNNLYNYTTTPFFISGNSYTLSFWAKAITNGGAFTQNIKLCDGTILNAVMNVVAIPSISCNNYWTRFTFPFTALQTGNTTEVYIYPVGYILPTGSSFCMYGLQLEPKGYSTSFSPSSRQSEFLYAPTYYNSVSPTNLLSPNIASCGDISQNTSGFSVNMIYATLTADNSNSFQGNYSLKIVTSGINNWEGAVSSMISVPSGQTYTASAYLYGTGGTVYVSMQEYCSGTNVGSKSTPITLVSGSWVKGSCTRTFTSGNQLQMQVDNDGIQALTYWTDAWQVESGSVAGSWVPGQTKRCLDSNQGTMEFWWEPKGTPQIWGRFFNVGTYTDPIDNADSITAYWCTGDGIKTIGLFIISSATASSMSLYVNTPVNIVPGMVMYTAFSWQSGGSAKLYVNNQVASGNMPGPLNNLNTANIYLGTDPNYEASNIIIHDFRLSSIQRSDIELLNNYNAMTPLLSDQYTTIKEGFDQPDGEYFNN